MATSILASLANWQFLLCHFPSVYGNFLHTNPSQIGDYTDFQILIICNLNFVNFKFGDVLLGPKNRQNRGINVLTFIGFPFAKRDFLSMLREKYFNAWARNISEVSFWIPWFTTIANPVSWNASWSSRAALKKCGAHMVEKPSSRLVFSKQIICWGYFLKNLS